MEITRTKDAEAVNAIVCEAFGRPIDQSKFLASDDNYALVGAHGVMLFGRSKPGRYGAVSAVKPSGQGQWAVEFIRAATAWMFTQTDATRLWAAVTGNNKRAIVAMKAAINVDVERSGDLSIASITKDRWSAEHDSMA